MTEEALPPILASDWFSGGGSTADIRRKIEALLDEPLSYLDPPADPVKPKSPNGYESVTLQGGQKMKVHHHKDCAGYWCPVHYPSPHHMSMWRQEWIEGKMWRICEHGYVHPDPDDLISYNDLEFLRGHHCDDCCKRPFDPKELL